MTFDDRIDQLLAAFAAAEAGQAALVAHLQAQIPELVEEGGQSQAGETSVTVRAWTNNLFLVEAVLIGLPAAATTPTLTLGGRVLPLPVQVTNVLAPVGFLLHPGDVRKLAWTGAGVGSLYLFGKNIPTAGVLR